MYTELTSSLWLHTQIPLSQTPLRLQSVLSLQMLLAMLMSAVPTTPIHTCQTPETPNKSYSVVSGDRNSQLDLHPVYKRQ